LDFGGIGGIIATGRGKGGGMTVRELVDRLKAIPNQDAEILVEVPDLDDPETPDEYFIEDVTFMDWPEHYRKVGDLDVIKFAKPQAYIKV
jgi:hypothetical protein